MRVENQHTEFKQIKQMGAGFALVFVNEIDIIIHGFKRTQ